MSWMRIRLFSNKNECRVPSFESKEATQSHPDIPLRAQNQGPLPFLLVPTKTPLYN